MGHCAGQVLACRRSATGFSPRRHTQVCLKKVASSGGTSKNCGLDSMNCLRSLTTYRVQRS